MIAALTSPLVIATHNPGKCREVAGLLAPLGIEVKSAGELGLPEPEETGDSFVENARIKARSAATHSGCMALADDSGLEVAALGGAPGIYSARWAGPDKDFSLAMQRIAGELEAKGISPEGQSARFVCALALCDASGAMQDFVGTVDGSLSFPPRGDNGFGYDPIFMPGGYDVTFAEMDAAAKQCISHRANAFSLLLEQLGLSGGEKEARA